MGFFDKILKGLGFEDEEETKVVKEPKVKVKKNKQKNNVIASYDLNNYCDEKNEEEKDNETIIQTNENVQTQSTDFEVVSVSSQEQVQAVVNKLKNGHKILLNIEKLSSTDVTRSLDFLTGAIFALNLKMQKIDEKIFLIQ